MSVEPFEWDNAEWAIIENKYGKLLTYNLPRYNVGYASLDYQSYITEMIESKKYHTFIDGGAYIGLFSQIASHYCHKVVAYEAHPFYFGILLFNTRFYDNIKCRYKYLSNNNRHFLPKIDDGVKGLVTSNSKYVYNIDDTSLDAEWNGGIPTSTLIKLDVEGSEIDVLEGSEYILRKPYVHWIIDVHTNRGITSESILEYFPGRKITMISPKVIKVEGKL